MEIAEIQNSVFKKHIPEWLKYFGIIAMMFPTIFVFSASIIGVPQAMGFYGISSADVQFSMLVFYAIVAAYAPFAHHLFARLPTKTYLWISIVAQLFTLYGCYHAQSLEFLVVMRVLNAICNAGINSICLDLLFSKLKSQNAREIGYSFLYGLILISGTICSLLGAYTFEYQDINHFYKFTMFSFLPGGIILTLILTNKRLVTFKLIRYKKIGIPDFILTAVAAWSFAYFMVYGQELDWFDDDRIKLAAFLTIIFTLLSLLRMHYVKPPYLSLHVFKYKNFQFGMILLVFLYLIRGAFNITTSYFFEVLESPVLETNQLMIYNILGIIIGSIFSTWMLIRKISMRFIWILGFIIMLIYYGSMAFKFSLNASVSDFIFLLILQGFGQGLLMNPIIVFYISSVPQNIGSSAGGFGVFVRFFSFTLSLTLINQIKYFYFSLYQSEIGTNLDPENPVYTAYLKYFQNIFSGKGVPPEKIKVMTNGVVTNVLKKELYVSFAQTYYEWISILIVITIVFILFKPTIGRTIINLKNKTPFGAGF